MRTRTEAREARTKANGVHPDPQRIAAELLAHMAEKEAARARERERQRGERVLAVGVDPIAAQTVLSAMAIDADVRRRLLAEVPADHFGAVGESHRKIRDAMAELDRRGLAYDPATLVRIDPEIDERIAEALTTSRSEVPRDLDFFVGALAHDAHRSSVGEGPLRAFLAAFENPRSTAEQIADAARALAEKCQPRARTDGPSTRLAYSDLRAAYASIGAERNWTVEGFFDGAPLIVIIGPEKKGKSWIVADLVRAMTTRGVWLGHFAARTEGYALVAENEYGSLEYARRLARISRAHGLASDALLGRDRVRHYTSHDLVLDPKCDAFKDLLADVQAEPPVLTVIDPLRNFLGDGDENKATDILKALGACARIRDASKAPVVVVHHLNKDGKSTGSRAITTRADLVLLGTDEESPWYSTVGRTVRSTDAIASTFAVDVVHEHDQDDTRATARLAWRTDGSNKARALTGTARRLLAVLKKHGKPLSGYALGKMTNTNGTVRGRALAELREARLVNSTDGKWSVSTEERWEDAQARMAEARLADDAGEATQTPPVEEDDQDAEAIF